MFTRIDGHTPELLRFLGAHGQKLLSLSIPAALSIPQLLDLCPNITELGIIDTIPVLFLRHSSFPLSFTNTWFHRQPAKVPTIEKCKPHRAITRIAFPNISVECVYI